MRLIAPTLLALSLAGNIACSRSTEPNSVNSSQTNSNQAQPGSTIPGAVRRNLIGDPREAGPFKFELKVPAGSRAAAHRHSIDVHVKVVSGAMFIIIGEPLESSRAQYFAAGSEFVVTARSWHVEWFDEETVVEGEGVGPMETIYKGS